MKTRSISYIIALAIIVSACSTAPTAVSTPSSINGGAALTATAEAHTSIPTSTFIPITETPAPTNTLEPSPTADIATFTETLLPTEIPTFTAQPTASDTCNKPLTSWHAPTATFTMWNETQPKGKVILLMSVLSTQGECGWLNIYSDSFSGPVGSYSAAAFVDGKKSFKVYGVFQITEGAWKIVVRNKDIVALGGCYPNC